MPREPDASPSRTEAGDDGSSAFDSSFAATLESDELYEMLVESASEGIIAVDESGRIAYANPAVEDVLGYRPDDLVGERLVGIIPERLRDDHLEGFSRYLRTGDRTVDWDRLELPGRHARGHEVPLAVSFRELDRGDDQYFVGLLRDISEQVEQRDRLSAESAFVDSMLDAIPDPVYAFDTSGEFIRWNQRATDVTGYSDEEFGELVPLDLVTERDRDSVASAISRVISDGVTVTVETRLVTKDGTEIPYEITGAPLVQDGEIVGQTGVGRDISERKRRERTLERVNDLNAVIRSVDRALVEGSTREEIVRAVCDRLVDEGAYCGAVIGTVDLDDGGFAVDAAAGVDHTAVTAVSPTEVRDRRSLAREAIWSESVAVMGDVDDSPVEHWRAAAREQGYSTIAAVPLLADQRRFGVLAVFSDRASGLSERERAVLAELGHGIGNAVRAALTRQLLYSDTVTEIELRTTNSDVAFGAVSEAAGCRLSLERVLSFGDETVFYFSATGAPPDRIVEAAAENRSIVSVDHLSSADDEHFFEVRTDSGTLTTVLVDLGARTTDGVADRGEVTAVAELPPDADVREVVRAVQTAFPGTELIARRQVDRSLRTPAEFRRELAADLTEKQRAALEAAYFAGYFEWPARSNSAQEVAETLDIAPQTFHQHLRVAERKLLSALFEADVGDR